MSLSYRAEKITDSIYWVGAIDWAIRDFHGYSTNRGTSYNAYLILADKVTLIDTVKAPFRDELLARIASVIDPSRIDYIVSNHAEMDHSGCLPEVIAATRPEKVFASKLGVRALADHFSDDLPLTAVANGESISLGSMNLTFFETKMLHWPESMVTWCDRERVLFSQDAFGLHLASSERFTDEINDIIVKYETSKYFANILMPFLPRALNILDTLAELALPIKILATDHGPIWRNEATRTVIDYYRTWATKAPTMKALVIYDTMWQSTVKMAHAITDGLLSSGAKPKVIPLGGTHRSDVATELLDSSALLVGSPTLNNNILPSLADVLTYVKGLKPKGLIGAAFGSYGWSGEAVPQIESMLTEMKIECIVPGVKAKYVPKADDLERCFYLGQAVGKKLATLLE